MSEESAARPARTVAEAEDALLSRWPETRLEPSLDRIAMLMDLLGDPQRAYRSVHITGTNGKTSTARMIDALLRAHSLRTGRFTSPHLERINERISVDGRPLDDEAFVAAYNDVAPYLVMVDEDQPFPVSFFDAVVGMAYAAFADAPVDVAVVEVGMGGTWDATNVIDAEVAVVTPIGVDHAQYLGDTPVAIAHEKAGIVKAGATAVVAAQLPEVEAVLRARAAEVGATLLYQGDQFDVLAREDAVGGQLVSVQGVHARYDDLFLPLHGEHQAQNLAGAIAAVESLLDRPLDREVLEAGLAQVDSPGRLEIVRTSPAVIVDAAHNPHGAESLVRALDSAFAFSAVVGVVSVMGDKDVEGFLAIVEPVFEHLVVTRNSQARAMPADQLGALAADVFGGDRVSVVPRLADAIDAAVALAEHDSADSISSAAVVVTGSVVTAGEARTLLARRNRMGEMA